MFTGLVSACGEILAQDSQSEHIRLRLKAHIENPVIGESIAVHGVCLTLIEASATEIAFDVSPETLSVTALGQLKIGDKVHLERALALSDRLGGHYVSGHVDTTATILSTSPVGDCLEVTIGGFKPLQMRYLCPKGSVAVDGVSLTINTVNDTSITVMLVPHTLDKTTLSDWHKGQMVNIEFDYIARIVVHQLGSLQDSTIMALLKNSDEGIEVSV